MGTQSLNWTPIGSTHPAKIEAAPLLKRLQLERALWSELVADRLGDGESAGLQATALVMGVALAGTATQAALIYAAVRACTGA